MKRGWYGESHRHKLARMGVKTTTNDKPVYTAIKGDSIITKETYESLSPEEKNNFFTGSETDKQLLEQKQLLLMKSGLPIGNWKRKTDDNEYIVWGLPQKPMHNPHNVVIRKETSPNGKREWVVFVDMGRDGGTSVLNKGGTMGENLLVAKDYMMKRRNY